MNADDPARRSYRTPLLIGVAVLMLVAGVAVWYLYRMHAFFHGFVAGNGRFPVTSAEEWPKPLKALVKDATEKKIEVRDLRVECMCKGYETEYVWRMQSTPGLFEFLVARWKLSSVPPSDHGIFCGTSMYSGDYTPEWWSPMETPKTRFYICSRRLANEYGDQFQVAIDDDRQLIFVQYYEKW